MALVAQVPSPPPPPLISEAVQRPDKELYNWILDRVGGHGHCPGGHVKFIGETWTP